MTRDDESTPPQPRQTTAYLKELFSQVGFRIDARRGQNFLVDLNLVDLPQCWRSHSIPLQLETVE